MLPVACWALWSSVTGGSRTAPTAESGSPSLVSTPDSRRGGSRTARCVPLQATQLRAVRNNLPRSQTSGALAGCFQRRFVVGMLADFLDVLGVNHVVVLVHNEHRAAQQAVLL